ncbi:MAG TPA: PQQ-dependent dehydrogenase, methanol/ethanol family [Candidatus Acidoferrum sp.]|nr:PQQ-dependent dehydrogenase, methanol/ethanol family [Candidatus Acidoferrum sp.]
MTTTMKSAMAAGLTAMLLATAVQAGPVDAKRIQQADSEAGQWLTVGRTYDEQRFSPLAKINVDNVAQLGLAWFADFDTNRGQEASPLVIDGLLFVTTAWSKVYAFDAKTGKPAWSYDPQVQGSIGIKGCCDVVNRGLAAWGDKLYLGAYDGRLIALDQKTGKVAWTVDTVDQARSYTITGAPRIANGKVFIGNGGAEIGVRGYLSAYDANNGKLLWRFFTVPGDPKQPQENAALEKALKTWTGDLFWQLGGGTVWDGILYDPTTNLVYFGTGNGTPWVAEARSPQGGDNLYLNSIIAVNADTGAYAWHYQTTPSESWDFDSTSPLMMADLVFNGEKHRTLMQGNKNGFFYALDATTGKLLAADPFTKVTWASGVDMKTGRPIENAAAHFGKTGKDVAVQPGAQGAHSWHPMSFSRKTGLIYLPMVETVSAFAPDPNYKARQGTANTAMGRANPDVMKNLPEDAPRTSRAWLMAWDPVKRKQVWRSDERGTIASGALSTAGGLVFQGSQKGEIDAFRDSDGKQLWSFAAQTGVVAAPVSYEIDGEQYIAQLAGYGTRDYYTGNRSRLLVFKLGGKTQLPPEGPLPPARPLNPPADFGTPEQLTLGADTWNVNCIMCHETAYGNRGLFPDIRYSPMLNSAEAFKSVVLGGVLESKGMVSFKQRFGDKEAEAIRAYMVQRANQAKAAATPR